MNKVNTKIPLSKVVQEEVLEMDKKVKDFKAGKMPEDKFAHFRLTRGFYGQRQQVETQERGIQMLRIKLPFGKLTASQLETIAAISEKYTNGNLHLTTRQCIQLHFVKIKDAPDIMTELAADNITSREACGNTVRNITGSSTAGIDPDEPFDISPYAEATFQYFLRNPICQDMGRKFKMAFSSSEKDSAYTFFHDIGVIPRVKEVNGKEVRGFKVLIGGGLGAQDFLAQTAFEFLEEDKLIPFIEGVLRVFDRFGEREKRFKARFKFLVKDLGLEAFLKLVEEEQKAIKHKSYKIPLSQEEEKIVLQEIKIEKDTDLENRLKADKQYQDWFKTNAFEQKQKGFYAVRLKVRLGNISSDESRKLADIVRKYAGDDIRITPNQGLLFKYIREEYLPYFYQELKEIGFADPGFYSIADITACPGTDTCNLGVTNSTNIANVLEEVIKEEFYDLIFESNLLIKISGCMNSCGQHMAAQIGFHGSSIKDNEKGLVIPALQVVLAGGQDQNGKGFIAEKVIKVPTKKAPDALRLILNEYLEKRLEGEYFNDFFNRLGKMHFFTLLKPLADKTILKPNDYIDWGHQENFVPEIGVGECAGVAYDQIEGLLNDASQQLSKAEQKFEADEYADAIYYTYNGFVISAKAMLLSEDVKCNTQKQILKDFDAHFLQNGELHINGGLEETVLQINQYEPEKAFATSYLENGKNFFEQIQKLRQNGKVDDKKQVIKDYFRA